MKKRNLLLSVSLVSLALVACGQDTPKTPEKTSVATKQVTIEKSTTAAKTKAQHTEKQSQDKANNQIAETTHSQNKSENQDNTNDKQDKVATQDNDNSSKDTTDKDTKKEEAVKEDATSDASEMDIAAIQEGDFSSIAGTWVDGNGHTLVFDENGLVSDSAYLTEMKVQDNGTLSTGVVSGYSGFAMMFLPKGKEMFVSPSQYLDPSNKEKDRIWAGHQASQDDSEFYYKVD